MGGQEGKTMSPLLVQIISVVLSAIFWRGCNLACGYYHTQRSKELKEEPDARWAAYGMSFIHASYCIVAGIIALILSPAEDDICFANALWRDVFILASCGYFVQDFFSEIAQPRKDWGMIFHHVFVPTFLFLSVHQHQLTHALALLLLNEGSTPFLCIRWNLKRLERLRGWTEQEERLYVRNGIVLLLTFLIFRVLLIPAIWLQSFLAGCLDPNIAADDLTIAMVYVANVNFPLLWLLNLFWFQLLVRGALKVLFPQPQKESLAQKLVAVAPDNAPAATEGAVTGNSTKAAR